MNIKIYYCVVWNYKPSAVSLAAELKASFGVDSELISGEKGDFEVVVDGKTVFSKKKLSRFPEPGEVTETLREWILNYSYVIKRLLNCNVSYILTKTSSLYLLICKTQFSNIS